MRAIQKVIGLLLSFLLIITMAACGNSEDEDITIQPNNTINNEATENTPSDDNSQSNTEPPKHEYIDGYEQLLSYTRIEEIEKCTSPDELCAILSNLYGEEITFIELKYEDIKDEFFVQKLAFYDVSKSAAPITKDMYAFFMPFTESPIFIMDSEGAYPVGNYEIKEFNGSHYHWVSAWCSTDLFLCLHSYTDCEGNLEERATWVEAVKSMDWYLEYETRILLDMFSEEQNYEIFQQIASTDPGVELLYPIIDGTIRSIMDDMVVKARDICSGERPYNYELLYPYQEAIIEYNNKISALEKTNDYNDWLLDTIFDDISWICLYVEDFVTFASQGFTDPRIEDYIANSYEFTDPIEAIMVFLRLM